MKKISHGKNLALNDIFYKQNYDHFTAAITRYDIFSHKISNASAYLP